MKARVNKPWLLVFLIHFFAFNLARAEGVRSIRASHDKMQPIYLSLGKSTILRFKDRPKKIVVGNQNYFGIEYIENDVAIQPLGSVKTNLFVYTESRVYGFHLVVGQGRQDDLVRIEWQPQVIQAPQSAPKFDKKKVIKGQKLSLGKLLTLIPESVQYSSERGMYFIDIYALNKSKTILDISDLKVLVSRGKTLLSPQLFVKEVEKLAPGKSCRLRLFFASKKTEALTLSAEASGKKGQLIISQRYL